MRSLGERESPTVNVIQRGMIEAETRIAALRMATRMTSLGHRVLSIYADAVFIEPTGPLPLMPPPWEVKGELTNLVFLNATSFESDQVTKLPGVVQDLDGRARARHARARIMGQALGSVRHSE